MSSAEILPYSVEAYKVYYNQEFMTGFAKEKLSTGQCDLVQAREIVRKLNSTIQPMISFGEGMLTSDQLVGGACSAIAFRVWRSTRFM